MNKVKFLPWVGLNYSDGLNGVKTLVLGESHYQWACGRDINDMERKKAKRERQQRGSIIYLIPESRIHCALSFSVDRVPPSIKIERFEFQGFLTKWL